MGIDELDEYEDEMEEKIFLEYRKKRMAEMQASLKSARFGEVNEITGQDYIQEVNKAGDGIWVILHLYKQGYNLFSTIMALSINFSTKFYPHSIGFPYVH